MVCLGQLAPPKLTAWTLEMHNGHSPHPAAYAENTAPWVKIKDGGDPCSTTTSSWWDVSLPGLGRASRRARLKQSLVHPRHGRASSPRPLFHGVFPASFFHWQKQVTICSPS